MSLRVIPSPQRATSQHSGAGVAIVGVAVIAGLNASLDHPVSAARRGAGAQAGVAVVVVAVVALLTGLDDAVTAGRRHAVCAVIRWVLVAVVAAFARRDDPVAAACGRRRCRQRCPTSSLPSSQASNPRWSASRSVRAMPSPQRLRAVVEAGVVVVGVAVVAALKIDLALTDVGAHDPIAAARRLTQARAGVRVVGVAVVAGLLTEVTELRVGAQDAVAAGADADVGAVVVGVVVAVIALLAHLHDPVAAFALGLTNDHLRFAA